MFDVRIDDQLGPQVEQLLRDHLAFAAEHSPPGSIHALDLDALRAPDITFWSVWDGDQLAGCGALRELTPDHGELKSMKTATAYLRRGVGSAVLDQILTVARERKYRRLSLETGAQDAFAPAREFYTRFGFEPCEPFGDYDEDRNSIFMTRVLTS